MSMMIFTSSGLRRQFLVFHSMVEHSPYSIQTQTGDHHDHLNWLINDGDDQNYDDDYDGQNYDDDENDRESYLDAYQDGCAGQGHQLPGHCCHHRVHLQRHHHHHLHWRCHRHHQPLTAYLLKTDDREVGDSE